MIDSRMGGMTLQQLLQSHGITRPIELADILGVHPHYAWALWHGKRRFSTRSALKLYHAKGIPIHELLQAQVQPTPVPKGRRRKRPSEAPPEAEGQA
jgi:transcriptional regulator with XRE-family HTH domain